MKPLFLLILLVLAPMVIFAGGKAEAEPAAPAEEAIVLDVYHWFGPEKRDAIEEINGLFKAETGIEIVYESAPTDQYRNVIKIKLRSFQR